MAHWDIRIEFETPKNNKYYAVGFLGEGETPENTEEVVRRIKEAGHRVANIPVNCIQEVIQSLPEVIRQFNSLLFFLNDREPVLTRLTWYVPFAQWFYERADPVVNHWGRDTLVLCYENPTDDSTQAEDLLNLRGGFQEIPSRFPKKFCLHGITYGLISVYPEGAQPPETCGNEIRQYGLCHNTGTNGLFICECRQDLPAEYREDGFTIAFPCWHGPGKWGGPPSPHSFYCLIYNEGQWNLRTVKSDQKLGPKCFLVKCLG